MNKVQEISGTIMSYVDPRYLVLINHTILLTTAVVFLDLRRTWEQILFAIIVAVVTELLLSKITEKQKKFDLSDRVLSATVLALGTLILVRSSYWWFYGLIAFFGVVSKYLLVNNQGRHIFNPTNVAIVFAIIILPEFLNVRVDSFSTHIFSVGCILFFGTLAVIKANSWRITLGYFGGICLLGVPAALILGYPVLIVLGPETNAAVYIVCFFNDNRSSDVAT